MAALELEAAAARTGLIATRLHLLRGQRDELLRGHQIASGFVINLDLEVIEDESGRVRENPERPKLPSVISTFALRPADDTWRV